MTDLWIFKDEDTAEKRPGDRSYAYFTHVYACAYIHTQYQMLSGGIYLPNNCPFEPDPVTGKFPALWVLPSQGQKLIPAFSAPLQQDCILGLAQSDTP